MEIRTGSRAPLVTIGIPTYNSGRYLRECLDSIAAQRFQDLEVVFSDNASTDDTVAIIEEYCGRHGWRFYRNPANIGALPNFNRLISLARGKYLAIYHADDVYSPEIVEESVRVLESDPSLALVGALCDEIDDSGALTRRYRLPPSMEGKGVLHFEDALRGVLDSDSSHLLLVTPSVMVRKGAYAEVGTFETAGKYRSSADYEMWLRIARHHALAVIPRSLMKYRMHHGQGSELENRRNIEVLDIVGVVEEYRHFVQGGELKGRCGRYLERQIMMAALKQNCCGMYKKSSETLQRVSVGFAVTRKLLSFCNRHSLSLERLRTSLRKVRGVRGRWRSSSC